MKIELNIKDCMSDSGCVLIICSCPHLRECDCRRVIVILQPEAITTVNCGEYQCACSCRSGNDTSAITKDEKSIFVEAHIHQARPEAKSVEQFLKLSCSQWAVFAVRQASTERPDRIRRRLCLIAGSSCPWRKDRDAKNSSKQREYRSFHEVCSSRSNRVE